MTDEPPSPHHRRRNAVQYLCLVYPPADFAVTAPVTRQFLALREAMAEAGVFLSAGQLQPVESATTIRVSGGDVVLTDGPFAEMKEHVGGYVLMDCRDLDEALSWAARLPGAQGGAVEIRPLVRYPD
jgi:hypothetical protein